MFDLVLKESLFTNIVLLGKSVQETIPTLQKTYGSSAMNQCNVYKWYRLYKEGERDSVFDEPRPDQSTSFWKQETNNPRTMAFFIRTMPPAIEVQLQLKS